MPLETLVQDFLEYIELEKNRSPKTVENYRHYLGRFLAHSGVSRPRSITVHVVEEYHSWLAECESGITARGENTTLSTKTQNYHLTALRTFLAYLHGRNITTLDPKKVILVKASSRTVYETLSPAECAQILDAPDGDDLKILRDRALLHVLASTHLKVSEVCALSIHSNLQGLSLAPEARHAVRVWIDARHDNEEALFIALGPRAVEGDNRLTPRSIQRIVRHYAAHAGISHVVTPQSFCTMSGA